MSFSFHQTQIAREDRLDSEHAGRLQATAHADARDAVTEPQISHDLIIEPPQLLLMCPLSVRQHPYLHPRP